MIKTDVFILTGEWLDINGKNELRFLGKSVDYGPVEIIVDNYRPFLFVQKDSAQKEFENLKY